MKKKCTSMRTCTELRKTPWSASCGTESDVPGYAQFACSAPRHDSVSMMSRISSRRVAGMAEAARGGYGCALCERVESLGAPWGWQWRCWCGGPSDQSSCCQRLSSLSWGMQVCSGADQEPRRNTVKTASGTWGMSFRKGCRQLPELELETPATKGAHFLRVKYMRLMRSRTWQETIRCYTDSRHVYMTDLEVMYTLVPHHPQRLLRVAGLHAGILHLQMGRSMHSALGWDDLPANDDKVAASMGRQRREERSDYKASSLGGI